MPGIPLKSAHNKARTLDWLTTVLNQFRVPELSYFKVDRWAHENDLIIEKMDERFCGRMLVVRSSAFDEDGAHSARAGVYKSVAACPVQIPFRTALRAGIRLRTA